MSKPFPFTCANCNKQYVLETTGPPVRSLMEPLGEILIYRITSDDMRIFLTELINVYAPGTLLELVPYYCQKQKAKRDKNSNVREGGYASLRLAFSEHILERPRNKTFYTKMGESQATPKFIESVLSNFIRKFEYSKKMLDELIDDYRAQEELENRYGMTQADLRNIRDFAKPVPMPTINGDNWIIFQARPELIIKCMLENPDTGEVDGAIDISDRVYPVSKGVVEFIVHVHPEETSAVGNPLVREMMMRGNQRS